MKNSACYNPAMNNLRFKWMGLFLFTAWIIAGCSSTLVTSSPGSELTTQAPTLKPYLTITPTPTMESSIEGTPVPIPSPSPTPRTHTVKAGESFGTIATLYGVSVDALIIANPEVNPNAMSIGIVLIIPAPLIDGEEPVTFPTPLAVMIQSTQCYEVVGNSIQCFISVSNPLDTAVEGVSAVLRYQVSDGNVKEIAAYSLLNAIPAGAIAPLLAAFPSDAGWDGNITAEIRSAIPAQLIEFPGTWRYQQLKFQMMAAMPG